MDNLSLMTLGMLFATFGWFNFFWGWKRSGEHGTEYGSEDDEKGIIIISPIGSLPQGLFCYY
jgi:hypothetical protein